MTASTSTTGLAHAHGAASRGGTSMPKPIHEAERSEALHRGLVKADSNNSLTSDKSSLSTVSGEHHAAEHG